MYLSLMCAGTADDEKAYFRKLTDRVGKGVQEIFANLHASVA
jgi:hypothetical protein